MGSGSMGEVHRRLAASPILPYSRSVSRPCTAQYQLPGADIRSNPSVAPALVDHPENTAEWGSTHGETA